MTAPTIPTATVEDVRSVIGRAKAGDRDAFAEIYRRYQVTVHRYVARRVSNPTVAEDLTAEVFCRALRGIGGFTWQGHDPVKWLCTIAANLIRDHFSLSSTRQEVISDDAVAGQDRRRSAGRRDPVNGDGPEAAVLASMTADSLREAIKNLTEQQQRCIVLRFFGGLDTEETAEQMGITARAVVSLQYRAIQALRDLLPASMKNGAEPTGRSWTVTSSPATQDGTADADAPSSTPTDVVALAAEEAPAVAVADVVAQASPATTPTSTLAPAFGAGCRQIRVGGVLIRIGRVPAADSSLLTCLLAGSCTCGREPLVYRPSAPSSTGRMSSTARGGRRGSRRSQTTTPRRPVAAGCSPRDHTGERAELLVRHVPSAFAPSSPSPPGRARPRGDQLAVTGTGLFMDLETRKVVTF